MQRSIASGLIFVLLAGCATFSTSDTASQSQLPDRDTTPVPVQQMRLLQVGDWYAVRLPEREGRSGAVRGVHYSGYVGRLQRSDDDSLTLTDVVKCTDFDSRSSLRHLPLVGSNFANGWGGCKNQPGTVTIPRSEVMWFEPISATEADEFQRYNEISKEPICLNVSETPDNPMAQFGVFDVRLPNSDFVLPNPKSEETRVQRWMEIREVKAGHWYNVLPVPERRFSPDPMKRHVAVVDHVDKDGIHFTNITTGALRRDGNPSGSETVPEMMLRFSAIDRVIPLTPEQAEEQIKSFNRPPELP